MIRNLTLLLTNKCNGKCHICNIWKEKITDYEMTAKEIQELLLYSDFKNVETISISGGEPFLREDILEILNIIFCTLNKLNTVFLNTNAISIRNIFEACELAVKSVENVVLSVSLEGKKETNFNVRGVNNYDTALKLLAQVKERFPTVVTSISMTINPFNANIESLEHIRDIAKTVNSGYSFRLADNSEQYYHNSNIDLNISDSQKEEIIKFIGSNLSEDPFMKIQYNYLKTGKNPLVIDENGQNICLAGDEFAFIKPDGTIYPCLSSSRCIGNLSQGIFTKNIKDLGKYENCPCCTECCTWPMITFNQRKGAIL